MSTRLGALVTAAIAVVVLALALPGAAVAAGDDAMTEDVLYMADGRILHGNILSETAKTIVFEVVDRRLNLKSVLAISRHDISQVERGVAVDAPEHVEAGTRRRPAVTSRTDSKTTESRFGRVIADDLDVPSVYIVPMRGQLGTDIHPSVYQDVAKNIREVDPDLIVLIMDCKDADDLLIPLNEATEQGLFMHHEYREIVDLFRDELREYRQVMWIEDSVGFSSLLAMAWDDIYMTPNARLGGLLRVSQRAAGWSDANIAAKMMAAWTGIGRGFLENGGYDRALADAMMRPEYSLSASFKGREVVWSLNDTGEFLIDGDDEETVGFRAKSAEDLLVSQGTADNLDDLAFILGYREYRMVGDRGESIVESYKESWRRTFDQAKELLLDYDQHRGWATGDETLRWLGRAKSDLEKVIRAMERYDAVEIRLRTDRGVTKLQLEIEVEKLREIIISLKQNRGGRGGGGRGLGGG